MPVLCFSSDPRFSALVWVPVFVESGPFKSSWKYIIFFCNLWHLESLDLTYLTCLEILFMCILRIFNVKKEKAWQEKRSSSPFIGADNCSIYTRTTGLVALEPVLHIWVFEDTIWQSVFFQKGCLETPVDAICWLAVELSGVDCRLICLLNLIELFL